MRKKLILIFGPSAVGKMTVGQELAKRTGLKLFHNHMSIELVLPFFDFDEAGFKHLNTLFRTEIINEVAKSDLPGMIVTYVWAIGAPGEQEYLDKLLRPFREIEADFYYVELAASLEERLMRNRTEHRLQHKASKRDVERSEKVLLTDEKNYRCNSEEGELQLQNHLKIDNTHLSPQEVVTRIVEHFGFD